MWILVYIFIVICSLVFVPGHEGFVHLQVLQNQFRVPKEAVFVILGSCVIALSFFDNRRKLISFRNGWIGAFLIFTVLSFGYLFFKPVIFINADNQVVHNIWNFRPTLNIIIGIFLMVTLVEKTDSLSRWINVSKVLCYLVGFLSIYSIFQWLGMDQIFGDNYTWNYINSQPNRASKMITFMGHPFLSSNYLAVISPLCLMFKDLRYKIFYGLIFISIILAKSSTALIVFSTGFLIFLFLSGRFKPFILTVFLLSISGFLIYKLFPGYFSDNGRVNIWKMFITSVENYYTGSGFGSVPMKFFYENLGKKMTQLSSHNLFVDSYVESGILGLILIFGYLLDLFRRSFVYWVNHNSMLMIGFLSCLGGYLIYANTGFPLRFAPTALLGILIISSIEAQINLNGG